MSQQYHGLLMHVMNCLTTLICEDCKTSYISSRNFIRIFPIALSFLEGEFLTIRKKTRISTFFTSIAFHKNTHMESLV